MLKMILAIKACSKRAPKMMFKLSLIGFIWAMTTALPATQHAVYKLVLRD